MCAAITKGETGQLVGFVLIGVGLILATGLAFFEVGLSEDRERAREAEAAAGTRARESERAKDPRTSGQRIPKRPGLGRLRGPRRPLR